MQEDDTVHTPLPAITFIESYNLQKVDSRFFTSLLKNVPETQI